MKSFDGARWEFEQTSPTHVEQDPTQQDQFNDEEFGLAEVLVREIIQNSMDAAIPGANKVRVNFNLHEVPAETADEIRDTFAGLDPHLAACGFPAVPQEGGIRALVVEDFGTKGLTGLVETMDEDNYQNFWRRHGASSKRGASGGRWGLGKLVYSSSSDIRSFFGLTVREGDERSLLLGQSVLVSHNIDDTRYPSHGFWFSKRGPKSIQMPITEAQAIVDFCSVFSLDRQAGETGLSVVVPFVKQSITDKAIVEAVVNNYYFPIMSGRLEVRVGTITITKSTFKRIAEDHASKEMPLDFVARVGEKLNLVPDAIGINKLNAGGINPGSFLPETTEELREKYDNFEVVHVRMPLDLTRSTGASETSSIDLFIRKIYDQEEPFAMFVRGAITVPGEARKFHGARARGAMVAREETVSTFLGDAENPSHTQWSSTALKLISRWSSPTPAIRCIRHALKDLHVLLSDHVDKQDKDALLDLFYLPSNVPTRKKVKKTVPVEVDLPPQRKSYRIEERKGGFIIVPDAGADDWTFPKRMDVRLAYNTISGDPFKNFSEYDFDIRSGDFVFDCQNASVDKKSASTFTATIESLDFRISVQGFDKLRDLIVVANQRK